MKKFMSIVVAVFLIISLVACNGSNSKENPDTVVSDNPGSNSDTSIGVVVKTLNSEYWKYVQAGAMQAGKDLGVSVEVIGPSAETDIVGQISMIEDLVAANIDAICVAPNESDAVIPALTTALDKDIPVLMIDTDADLEGKTTFLGTGHEAAAKMGGEYIGELAGEGKKAVIVGATLGNATSDARIAGFKEGLENYGIEILDVQAADASADKAMNVMENFLQKYDQIDIVMSANDDMAMGILRALNQSGRDNILLCGYDGISIALDEIENGNMTCTIAQQPYNIGYMGVEAAVKSVNGESVDERIDTGAALIQMENVAEYREELDNLLELIEE